ncbi:MAG: SH3 domain-containing protein [Candidatus Aureabacteria bacterium]|nr:SH3 domain-containing protein [Candidatus Auribacterota bacterium]
MNQKKKYVSFPIITLFLFSLFHSFAFSQPTDTYFPYVGRVTGKNVNIRATANLGSEVMGQLEEGRDIVIIGEESGWCRIRPEENAKAWIYADLVKNGIVTKDNVNIRAGATLSSSVLGKLHEGDTVVIVERFEDWYQIEMPLGMGYYIHKDFIKYLCPVEEYDYFLEKEKKTKQMFKDADEYRRNELRKRYNEVNYDLIIQKFQKIIDFYPDSIEAEKSLQRIADAQEKKKIAQTRIQSKRLNLQILKEYDRAEEERRRIIYSESFDPAEYDAVIDMYQKIITDYPDSRAAKESLQKISQLKQLKEKKISEWESQAEFTFEGTLEKGSTSATDKANHKIVDSTGQLLGYVYSEAVDLRAYEGRRVKVEGMRYTYSEESSAKRVPVLKIKTISLE